ncbi:MAG: hypothetical protein R6U65_07115, partial [Perlabentimonas sp.]
MKSQKVLSSLRCSAIVVALSLLQSCNISKTDNIKCILPKELSKNEATIFAPNLVSTHMAERDAALSPSGDEFYYTISSYIHQVIVFTKKSANGWTEPQVAPFSGIYSDLEPHFSTDGNRLYFASNRPLVEGGETKDFDIWYVDRKDKGWSDPINIG